MRFCLPCANRLRRCDGRGIGQLFFAITMRCGPVLCVNESGWHQRVAGIGKVRRLSGSSYPLLPDAEQIAELRRIASEQMEIDLEIGTDAAPCLGRDL